jgi:tripartite-type tricarboxylate transporter receptor subunit TctC
MRFDSDFLGFGVLGAYARAEQLKKDGLMARTIPSNKALSNTTLSLQALALTALLSTAGDAAAQPVEQFFARKTLTVTIGYTAGGSYDLYGRMVARHLGRHIPGQPTIIAQNMPGAGSLKAANYLYEVAPKDGSALGVVVESAALEQALANPAVQYDAARFSYLGRIATSNNIFMQWHTAKVQSLDDARRIETSLAGTGPGSIADTVPKLLNALTGTKFKLISGYPASSEAMLAMERGEVDGASSSWAAVKAGKQAWLREKKIRIILQTTPERVAELPEAPSLGEIGDTPEDRQVFALYASGSAIGRSLLAPPGIPAERVQALRDAFRAMVKDPEFASDLQRMNVELEPLPGEAVAQLVARALAVPAAVRERAKSAFGR